MRCITYKSSSLQCKVTLPQSKSILNRLLIINQLSGSESTVEFVSGASDVLIMQKLLRDIQRNLGTTILETEIDSGNAGTVMRFLTSVLAITPGNWIITGTEQMQKRPISPLVEALQSIGAEISYKQSSGYPPLCIKGNPELTGGFVKTDAGTSSQFISSLMMIGPRLKGGLTIELQGNVTSGSYIRMTLELMRKAGVEVFFNGREIIVREGKYTETDFRAMSEPDWSAAAFWFQVVAFAAKSDILLKSLKVNSLQGDSVLPEIFSNLGVNSVFTNEGLWLSKSNELPVMEFNYDFTDCPDLAQAVIVSCATLGIKGHFTGLKTLRIKETDRIEALKTELSKLGYGIKVVENEVYITGGKIAVENSESPLIVKCYDDHRMAMSFAPLAILHPVICLDDPDVVKKSYPGFWKDLEMAGLTFVK